MKEKKTARRDRGSGGVRQRKDGRWEGRLTRGLRPTETVYGKSKKDVIEKLFVLQKEPPKERQREDLTVGQWLDRWLKSVKENPTLRPATYRLYNNTVELHAPAPVTRAA